MKQKRPYFSIIIPARNEEHYLPKLLSSLKSQSFRDFETLVVANSCTDKTAVIARSFNVRVFETKRSGVSFARNFGLKRARGKVVIFLDADTTLSDNALDEIKKSFSEGYSVGTLKGKPDKIKLYYLITFFFRNLSHRTGFYKGSTGIIIVRKDSANKVGGFDEKMKVRENRRFIKDCLKYGKYRYIFRGIIKVSMRRYEQIGFISLSLYWVKVFFKSFYSNLYKESYAIIRR